MSAMRWRQPIERGTQRLSLRQGVLRLLTSLELQDLGKDWDRQLPTNAALWSTDWRQCRARITRNWPTG